MALDHVRDYFHADAFLYDPLDLDQTGVLLFLTRWITHFCAPVFVFLAGTSAFLVGERKGKKELSLFLIKRGLWLIVLEFTVVNFGWYFNVHFTTILFVVIWALGISMVVLGGLIFLPRKIILAIGVLLVVGHNLLDNISVAGSDWMAVSWALLHQWNFFQFGEHNLFIAYPITPWIGVMALGYCFGSLYSLNPVERKNMLTRLGGSAIVLFVLIRGLNAYGDPSHWSYQSTSIFSFLSFLNTTKYPPSLLYLLMTLGPAILFLAYAERPIKNFFQPLVVVGRVPMFYYLLHLYLIHGLALIAAVTTGFGFSSMVNIPVWVTESEVLKGYGFNLWVVYGVWAFVVLALFPLCKWYDRYKRNHRDNWWLSYL